MASWFSICAKGVRIHCVACRTDAAWRESLARAGLVDHAEFDCPHGVTESTAYSEHIRDRVARAKTPAELAAIATELRQGKGTCCGQSPG